MSCASMMEEKGDVYHRGELVCGCETSVQIYIIMYTESLMFPCHCHWLTTASGDRGREGRIRGGREG